MEFHELFTFLTILNESIKILPKNGKLFALITILSEASVSCFYHLFIYSIQSLITDTSEAIMQTFFPDLSSFNFNIPDPNSLNSTDLSSFTPSPAFNSAAIAHLIKNAAFFFTIENVLLVVVYIISFFSSVATIIVANESYIGKYLSAKDLLSVIQKKWSMALVTSLYISGFAIGYFAFFLILALPLLMYNNIVTITLAILLGIAASLLYLYLFITLFLAIVVSVVEEKCYGLKALWKAEQLGKGMRQHGLLLNVSLNIVTLIIYQMYKIFILGNKGLVNVTLYGFFSVITSALLMIFTGMAHTAFYFHCKKHHGEEKDLQGSLQYTELPTTQLASAHD